MKHYLLYGVSARSLTDARLRIEGVLDVVLAPHHSGYRGGDYFRVGLDDEEHLIVMRNYDDEFEHAWAEHAHATFPFLLYINETDATATHWSARLVDVAVLLRAEEA